MNATTNIGILGIVGGGKMGQSLFQYFHTTGLDVVWVVRNMQNASVVRWQKRLARLTEPGGKLVITDQMDVLGHCQWVIETVTEDVAIKQEVLGQVINHLSDGAVILTNSSSITPQKLLGGHAAIGRFAGMHFFYPVAFHPYAELMLHDALDPFVVEGIHNFCRLVGLAYADQKDESIYFMANRLLLAFQEKAFEICIHKGIHPNELENIVKEEIHPEGIFTVCEHIGISTLITSIKNYYLMPPQQAGSGMLRALEAFQSSEGWAVGGCLSDFLAGYSEKCNNTLSRNVVVATLLESIVRRATSFIESSELEKETVKAVLYDILGFKNDLDII